MALFGLTDVQISGENNEGADIDYLSNKESSTIYRYPAELSQDEVPHYMLFTIYAQEYNQRDPATIGKAIGDFNDAGGKNRTAEFRNMLPEGSIGSVYVTASDMTDQLTEKLAQYVQPLLVPLINKLPFKNSDQRDEYAKTAATAVNNFKSSLNLGKVDKENFLNRVKKIKNSIALYMPDTLQFGHAQGYSEISTNYGTASAGANMIDALLKNGASVNTVSKNLTPFIYQGLQSLPNVGTVGYTAFTNQVVNPQLELIYSSPNMRDFTFSFAFYPRSPSEAKTVSQIINLFKFHAAPELKTGDSGFFLIPPSLFDIQFMIKGQENPNLPVIASCALTSIDVNYAPHGWASYQTGEIDFGGSGNPVATTMTLRFKETIVHSKHTLQNWQKQMTS